MIKNEYFTKRGFKECWILNNEGMPDLIGLQKGDLVVSYNRDSGKTQLDYKGKFIGLFNNVQEYENLIIDNKLFNYSDIKWQDNKMQIIRDGEIVIECTQDAAVRLACHILRCAKSE